MTHARVTCAQVGTAGGASLSWEDKCLVGADIKLMTFSTKPFENIILLIPVFKKKCIFF